MFTLYDIFRHRNLDADGNLVRLDKPAERVISLAPSLTEILFAIGAAQRVVGVIEYSDFRPKQKHYRLSEDLTF